MATWHQEKNTSALAQLWAPDPIRWKCISDAFDRPAGVMFFATEHEARTYAARTGDVVIAPRPNQQTNRSTP